MTSSVILTVLQYVPTVLRPPNPRLLLFFFIHTTPPEIYPLSLHDALPICLAQRERHRAPGGERDGHPVVLAGGGGSGLVRHRQSRDQPGAGAVRPGLGSG